MASPMPFVPPVTSALFSDNSLERFWAVVIECDLVIRCGSFA
jgi:hypothetical protein